MTWGEFKKKVEDQGVKDDDEVVFIDWANDAPDPEVSRYKDQRVFIA